MEVVHLDRFEKYSGTVELTVDGITFKMSPSVKTVAKLMSTKGMDNPEDTERTIISVIDLICEQNPESSRTNVEQFVVRNWVPIFEELLISLGITTRAKLEESKKQRLALSA